jgi:hypothetical protein
MTIFETLKADHEKVAGIFERLEPTTERGVKTRTELFARLKTELDAHANLEETVLYPALLEYEETREIALEGVEEHRVVKKLLAELEAMPVDSEQWKAKLTVLKENVEHHVEEEEGEMFKSARKALSREKINDLTARAEAKKKALTAGTQR